MMLDHVMEELKTVREGTVAMTPELADNVLDAMYMLMEMRKVSEEKLAYYKELEAEGRMVIRKPAEGEKCGTCRNYDQEPGTLSGYCKVRKERRRPKKALFVYRSRNACKDYRRRE